MKALLMMSLFGLVTIAASGCTSSNALPSLSPQLMGSPPARAHRADCPTDSGGIMTGDTGC